MPSANKTPLGLHQWQANEYPKMADFNEDNRIIDQKLTELQSGSGVKIYTVEELTDPAEGKIYNVKITKNTSTINEKPVYKENTSESVTLKAGKVATVYFSGGNFFYKASASGNAVAENVLAGKKFSNGDDTDITGTMSNHGGKVFKPSTANIIIPKGFHNGTGYVEGDPDLVSGNIVSGKQIFGVDGSALEYTAKQKEDIANAITSKGVATSTTASFEQMALNIRNIRQDLGKREEAVLTNSLDTVNKQRLSDSLYVRYDVRLIKEQFYSNRDGFFTEEVYKHTVEFEGTGSIFLVNMFHRGLPFERDGYLYKLHKNHPVVLDGNKVNYTEHFFVTSLYSRNVAPNFVMYFYMKRSLKFEVLYSKYGRTIHSLGQLGNNIDEGGAQILFYKQGG